MIKYGYRKLVIHAVNVYNLKLICYLYAIPSLY